VGVGLGGGGPPADPPPVAGAAAGWTALRARAAGVGLPVDVDTTVFDRGALGGVAVKVFVRLGVGLTV